MGSTPTVGSIGHIDGDSDNTEENLRLICQNCRALTPSHKGKNRGRGRTRQRVKNQRYGLKYQETDMVGPLWSLNV